MSLYLSKKQLMLLGMKENTVDLAHAILKGGTELIVKVHEYQIHDFTPLVMVLSHLSPFHCTVTLGLDPYSQADFILAGPDINCCNVLKGQLSLLEKQKER